MPEPHAIEQPPLTASPLGALTDLDALVAEVGSSYPLPELWSDLAQRPRVVRIENFHTYSQFKIIADDFAGVLCHPASGCVQIEGLLHLAGLVKP